MAPEDVRSRTKMLLGDVGQASSVLRAESTVVWCSNLLYDQPLMRRIAALLEAAPSVRCVALLSAVDGGLEGFVADELPIHCQMSWTEASADEHGHPCIVYRRCTEGWWMGRRAT